MDVLSGDLGPKDLLTILTLDTVTAEMIEDHRVGFGGHSTVSDINKSGQDTIRDDQDDIERVPIEGVPGPRKRIATLVNVPMGYDIHRSKKSQRCPRTV